MNTTTMLGVMADVVRVADSYVSTLALDDQLEHLMFRAAEAKASSGDARREALRATAAAALVALHALDAEAAQSSGAPDVDRAGHGPDCKVDMVMSHCTFDCPKRRARATDTKETR